MARLAIPLLLAAMLLAVCCPSALASAPVLGIQFDLAGDTIDFMNYDNMTGFCNEFIEKTAAISCDIYSIVPHKTDGTVDGTTIIAGFKTANLASTNTLLENVRSANGTTITKYVFLTSPVEASAVTGYGMVVPNYQRFALGIDLGNFVGDGDAALARVEAQIKAGVPTVTAVDYPDGVLAESASGDKKVGADIFVTDTGRLDTIQLKNQIKDAFNRADMAPITLEYLIEARSVIARHFFTTLVVGTASSTACGTPPSAALLRDFFPIAKTVRYDSQSGSGPCEMMFEIETYKSHDAFRVIQFFHDSVKDKTPLGGVVWTSASLVQAEINSDVSGLPVAPAFDFGVRLVFDIGVNDYKGFLAQPTAMNSVCEAITELVEGADECAIQGFYNEDPDQVDFGGAEKSQRSMFKKPTKANTQAIDGTLAIQIVARNNTNYVHLRRNLMNVIKAGPVAGFALGPVIEKQNDVLAFFKPANSAIDADRFAPADYEVDEPIQQTAAIQITFVLSGADRSAVDGLRERSREIRNSGNALSANPGICNLLVGNHTDFLCFLDFWNFNDVVTNFADDTLTIKPWFVYRGANLTREDLFAYYSLQISTTEFKGSLDFIFKQNQGSSAAVAVESITVGEWGYALLGMNRVLYPDDFDGQSSNIVTSWELLWAKYMTAEASVSCFWEAAYYYATDPGGKGFTPGIMVPTYFFTYTAEDMATTFNEYIVLSNNATMYPSYEWDGPQFAGFLAPALNYQNFTGPPATPSPASPMSPPASTPATAPVSPISPAAPIPGNGVSGNLAGAVFTLLVPDGVVFDSAAFCRAIVAANVGVTQCRVKTSAPVGSVGTKKFTEQATAWRVETELTTADNTVALEVVQRLIDAINNDEILTQYVITDVELIPIVVTPPDNTAGPPPVGGPPRNDTVVTGEFTIGDILIVFLTTQAAFDSARQAAVIAQVQAALQGIARILSMQPTTAARKFTTAATALNVGMNVRAPASLYPNINAIVTRLQAVVKNQGGFLGGVQVLSISAGQSSSAVLSSTPAVTLLAALLIAVLSLMLHF